MKIRKNLLAVLLVLTALAIASYGCGGDSQSKENGEEDKEPVVPVEVAAVKRVLDVATGNDSRWALVLGSALFAAIAIVTITLSR